MPSKFQDEPIKIGGSIWDWKIAIFGKSRLKFAHAIELHMSASLLPAITLARSNKIFWWGRMQLIDSLSSVRKDHKNSFHDSPYWDPWPLKFAYQSRLFCKFKLCKLFLYHWVVIHVYLFFVLTWGSLALLCDIPESIQWNVDDLKFSTSWKQQSILEVYHNFPYFGTIFQFCHSSSTMLHWVLLLEGDAPLLTRDLVIWPLAGLLAGFFCIVPWFYSSADRDPPYWTINHGFLIIWLSVWKRLHWLSWAEPLAHPTKDWWQGHSNHVW